MSEPPVLRAEGIAAGHADGPDVLVGAHIEVARGERLALLGANGSGKTTLLRVLSGSMRPRAGTVSVCDVALAHSRRGLDAHRRRVQLVLQDPAAQLFSADVRQDVAFGPLNLGLPLDEVRERVDETLAMLSITDLAERPVHQLSLGQQKRVALAGAVAMRPEVLLLDEPTAGLDPAGTAELLASLDVLERTGTTVVVATHDVALAWSWADVVAVVDRGAVRQEPTSVMLTDTPALRAARLEPPWQVALLRDLDLAPGTEPRARTAGEVAQVVRRSRGSDPGGG
ncbi:energy-coupling factor ABC transporter ATP-binding protein [Nocardioides marmoraquaticus]